MATAFPHYKHYLEPMFIPTDSKGEELDLHHCYWCKPEFYARLAPGFTLCSCFGVVILTGNEDDPYNEAMELCDDCEARMVEDANPNPR